MHTNEVLTLAEGVSSSAGKQCTALNIIGLSNATADDVTYQVTFSA